MKCILAQLKASEMRAVLKPGLYLLAAPRRMGLCMASCDLLECPRRGRGGTGSQAALLQRCREVLAIHVHYINMSCICHVETALVLSAGSRNVVAR